MSEAEFLVDIERGEFTESRHRGHAVVCRPDGEVIHAWGNSDRVTLPRSSIKMLQALPLVESGAANASGLTDKQLALACASHQGAEIHTVAVQEWMENLGFSENDLACGPQFPRDRVAASDLLRTDQEILRVHNNCSGKHTGFLTLSKHLSAGPDYVNVSHPVQKAILEAFEDMVGETSPGFGIDGCSAPNFASSLKGVAHAMAKMAAASDISSTARDKAGARLVNAMRKHPELVAGEGRACTELMRAMNGQTVVKTGAEGVFIAIIPEQKLGVALKIEDGSTRAAECVLTAILVKLGALDEYHPSTQKRLVGPIRNRDGLVTGRYRSLI